MFSSKHSANLSDHQNVEQTHDIEDNIRKAESHFFETIRIERDSRVAQLQQVMAERAEKDI